MGEMHKGYLLQSKIIIKKQIAQARISHLDSELGYIST